MESDATLSSSRPHLIAAAHGRGGIRKMVVVVVLVDGDEVEEHEGVVAVW